MCSIIEAWGDNDFTQLTGRNTPSANEAAMNGIKNNQMALDAQRMSRNTTDLKMIQQMSMYPEPDKVGEPVTWADNRRQYARPAGNLMENGSDGKQGWGTAYCKPRQDMNSMTRGVHSRYSREKRFDARTAELPFGGSLTTDVDPSMITGDPSNRPGYLDLFAKPYEDRKWGPSTTTTTTQQPRAGNAIPEAGLFKSTSTTTPQAANATLPESFMQVVEYEHDGDTTYDKPASQIVPTHRPASNNTFTNTYVKSPFTEEVITDPRIIAENRAARMEKQTAVPEDIRAIQNQLNSLVAKMNNLEKKMTYVENNKSHDIILFIVIAIFILFVLDNVFKLGKFS